MTIPDAALIPTIVILVPGLLWAGRMFVKQEVGEKGDKGDRGDRGSQGLGGFSARDYRELSDMLVLRLNGRYMLATESRERFDALEHRLSELHNLVINMGKE